jgi:GxxExxY protein
MTMPINLALKLKSISDHEFADIDEVVMKCAYASQNYFGRLFDERVYENDLAARLRAEGSAVHTQVPIVLCHAGFEKRYSMDLVVNDMLYELKAVDALTGEHDVQALNYAMLQNIRLVKVINFGEAKVRGKLLRNALVDGGRNHATCNRCEFVPLGRQCERLLRHLNNLLCDWGTHLSCRLYNEALVHEFGGDLNCLQRVELSAHGQILALTLCNCMTRTELLPSPALPALKRDTKSICRFFFAILPGSRPFSGSI